MQSSSMLSLHSAAVPPGDNRNGKVLFISHAYPASTRLPGFLFSVGLHLVGLLLLPGIASRLNEPTDREQWIRQQRIYRTLRIRIPEQLYIASTGVTSTDKKKVAVEAAKSQKGKEGSSGRESGAPPKRVSPRKKIELPPVPPEPDAPHTVLQPQYAADLQPSAPLSLPELFFWAPQPEPDYVVKPYQSPGHVIRPTQPRLLDAPPRLDIPTSEPSPVDTTAQLDPSAFLTSMLGASLPIRVADMETQKPKTGVSAEPNKGDATNVLSLTASSQRMKEYLSVPSGNQVGEMPDAGKSGSIYGEGAGYGTGSGAGAGSGSGAGGTGGVSAEELAAARTAAVAASMPSRVLHPVSGVFDVVVQSAGVEGFPESAGVLSGRPIYSVFIAAGGQKDWILQYCIPGAEDHSATVSGAVVKLSSGTAVTAPYPRVTFRPAVNPHPGHYLMVYGIINTSGKFQDLRILGRTDPFEIESVLGVLDQWEFRPSYHDGQPVRVEVLVAIPTD